MSALVEPLRMLLLAESPAWAELLRELMAAMGSASSLITATSWDGHLVHPDKAYLSQLDDKLADNVRGWQKAFDPDGDGLLLVDSHWWTGME